MTSVCPDCGSPLPEEKSLLGLCPQCLLSMALEDEEPETLHGAGAGRILGERYQIREVLGLTSHGNRVLSVALDPKGEIAVTGDFDGIVRVGPVSGGEPHLLYGHRLEVTGVAVSPDGKWIASGSQDGTIRLWPMPEGQPFHTLPYQEILARLRSFTNLRVVRDATYGEGYRLEAGPFPGWKTIPRW